MRIINPATEEIIGDLPEDQATSLQQKLIRLKEGQKDWYARSPEQRVEILRRYSALLEEHRERLSLLLTREVGKPLQQSRNEINGARTRMQWLLDNALKYLSPETMTTEEGLTERITYEPLGVVCNISAWNYPWLVGVNVYIPALLAGNAVLYKPSEYASLTGLEMSKLLYEAGVPEKVFIPAIGGKETGETLLDLPFDGYFFTGSWKTGQHIYTRVAAKMVPCQCELGGKDPLYVADDVLDISAVAAGTADGAFYNNGQSCCAVERIYVHRSVFEAYTEAFVREVKSWKCGSPEEPGVYIGPLTRQQQLDVLDDQVQDAINRGATLLTGGKRMTGKGWYYEPTVLTNVTNDMKVMREESFGPIIGIMAVDSDEEAIRLMNDTEYGLTSAV